MTNESSDPYLWLEEIDGAKAVAWVDAENRRTEGALYDEGWKSDYDAALAILDSDDKIPFVSKSGDWLYNFWKDAAHPRGLWRRTTLDQYRKTSPQWDVLLDIGALNKAEGIEWAFGGAVRSPDRTRALVSLSFNGTDAVEIREFDFAAKSFVNDGFVIPKAKGSAAWLNADTLLFNSALGDAHTTASGYGRTVRKLKRGQRIDDAEVVFEVEAGDMGAWFDVNHRPGSERLIFWRSMDFTRSEVFMQPLDGASVKLNLPEEAKISLAAHELSVSPKQDWRIGGTTIPAGALAIIDFNRFVAGAKDFEIVFTPSATHALEDWIETRHGLVLETLDNVRSRILLAKRSAREDNTSNNTAGWTLQDIAGLPTNAAIHAAEFGGEDDPDLGAEVLFTVTDYTTPTTLSLWNGRSAPERLKSAPESFNASGIEIEQRHAIAADGERIPYFLIGTNLKDKAPRPALLYGYGGFEVSMTPGYMAITGKLWLERGFLFAVANIRGGGEFGPRWHEAARKATKHVAHDDFASVAKDMIASGVTTARQLACEGGSNGGLLVGNMLTRYPDLFGAIWCAVPLLDMQRYAKLLAGHSWIAEYGDPDDPAEWEFLRKFSPYHLLRDGAAYPPIFITTNRTDDRVHPGHARKMAARLREMGAPVWFHETVAGGHSGAVDNTRQAATQALGFSFLRHTICQN